MCTYIFSCDLVCLPVTLWSEQRRLLALVTSSCWWQSLITETCVGTRCLRSSTATIVIVSVGGDTWVTPLYSVVTLSNILPNYLRRGHVYCIINLCQVFGLVSAQSEYRTISKSRQHTKRKKLLLFHFIVLIVAKHSSVGAKFVFSIKLQCSYFCGLCKTWAVSKDPKGLVSYGHKIKK